jgi:hypothetical protein
MNHQKKKRQETQIQQTSKLTSKSNHYTNTQGPETELVSLT